MKEIKVIEHVTYENFPKKIGDLVKIRDSSHVKSDFCRLYGKTGLIVDLNKATHSVKTKSGTLHKYIFWELDLLIDGERVIIDDEEIEVNIE